MTLNKFNLNNARYYKEIIKHAKEFPEEEVCGIISLNKILVVEVNREINESEDKANSFRISSKKTSGRSDILGIYHSHPKGGPEPSSFDIENSEEMGIPFLIYSNEQDSFYLYFPTTFKPRPLAGRPYVTGFFECTRIVLDYFSDVKELKSKMAAINHWQPLKDRDKTRDYIYSKFNDMFQLRQKYCEEVDRNDIKKNDILMLDNGDKQVPHAAVYEGDGMIVHQTAYQLSHREEFDDRWQEKLLHVYRVPYLV